MKSLSLIVVIFAVTLLIASCSKEKVKIPSPKAEFLLEWGISGERDVQFNQPIGIAIDDEGYIYISDSGNNRIQKFSEFGELYSKWNSGGSQETALQTPMHITSDGKNIYVTEYDSDRVQKFSPGEKSLMNFGKGDSKDSALDAPSGVAVDKDGNVYVIGSHDSSVKKYSPKGEFLIQIGSPGKGEKGKFNYPADLAIGNDGNVYVTDPYNNGVQVFSPEGGFIRKWGDTPRFGNKAAKDSFNVATGIDIDIKGRVYVADSHNHRIQIFDPEGNFLMSFGKQGKREGEFESPTDVAIDKKGNIYVVDSGNDRVQKLRINWQKIK